MQQTPQQKQTDTQQRKHKMQYVQDKAQLSDAVAKGVIEYLKLIKLIPNSFSEKNLVRIK